jgi:hypothetical protein
VFIDIFLLTTAFVITLFTIVKSFLNNKDLFSPVKVFVLFNIFFYFDIYINEYNYIIKIIYIINCLAILLVSFYEPHCNKVPTINFKMNRNFSHVVLAIWLLSSISILNQALAINELGGVINYIANISNRVLYFKGKGYVIIFNSWIAILNVYYFSQMLIEKKKSKINKVHWFIFLLHTLIFLFMAVLSGSRSFLLMTILLHLISFHYVHSALKVKKIIFIFSLIMFFLKTRA